MSKDYTIKDWKPWENEDGLVRDSFGNYRGSVLFDEESGEPIDATFKEQPKVGDKKYGDIVEYTTKAGSIRTKFQGAKRDTPPTEKPTPKASGWQPRDDDAIKAQFAIKAAIQYAMTQTGAPAIEDVEGYAKIFFAMIDTIKASPATPAQPTGYDSFKQQGQRLKSPIDADEMPADFLRGN